MADRNGNGNGGVTWQIWMLGAGFSVVVLIIGWDRNSQIARIDHLEAAGSPALRERMSGTEVELRRMHEQTAQQHTEIMAELTRQHGQIDKMQTQILDLVRACR